MGLGNEPQKSVTYSRDQIVKAVYPHGGPAPRGDSVLGVLLEELGKRLPESGITSAEFAYTFSQVITDDAVMLKASPALRSVHEMRARVTQLSESSAALGISNQVPTFIKLLDLQEANARRQWGVLMSVVADGIVSNFSSDPSWAQARRDMVPDTTTIKGVGFTRAPLLEINRPEVAAPYLKGVDDMAHWIVGCVRRHGLTVPENVLTDPPSFSYGTIDATGAIGVVFEGRKIELWTPFGMFAASDIGDRIPPEVVRDIKEKFGLVEVNPSPGTMDHIFGPPALFVASRGVNGEELPIACRRSSQRIQGAVELWAKARPEGRRSVGEEHVLSPAELKSLRPMHDQIARTDLVASDPETRRDAFSTLTRAGRDFLPSLLSAFACERDGDTKRGMFYELCNYKGILTEYPAFGEAVSAYLEAALPTERVAERSEMSHHSYHVIDKLRDIGPVAPDKIVPLLVRALEVFPDPQWPLDLLAMYGKEAEPARKRVEELTQHPSEWVRRNASQVLARLDR